MESTVTTENSKIPHGKRGPPIQYADAYHTELRKRVAATRAKKKALKVVQNIPANISSNVGISLGNGEAE